MLMCRAVCTRVPNAGVWLGLAGGSRARSALLGTRVGGCSRWAVFGPRGRDAAGAWGSPVSGCSQSGTP